MASFTRVGRMLARPLLQPRAMAALTTTRTYAYWNPDWQPGPFPTTEEERVAAAKKYGLRRDDYEPYPDDGFGYGDYPKLPIAPADSRDANEVWDMPEIRKNYGEPVHVDADAMTEDRWNPLTPYHYSFKQMYAMAFVIFGTAWGIYYLVDDYPTHSKTMPKQYPKEGIQHYTFNTEE